MKNADMPAMPIVNDNGAPHFTSDIAMTKSNCVGMTKREMIAMHAMQGYISGNLAWTDGADGGAVMLSVDEAAREAVSYADALLKELEK